MGLGEGVGIEGELESSRGDVRSPLREKEAALAVGRLNANNFLLLRLTFEHSLCKVLCQHSSLPNQGVFMKTKRHFSNRYAYFK